jgi:hypothetical protein
MLGSAIVLLLASGCVRLINDDLEQAEGTSSTAYEESVGQTGDESDHDDGEEPEASPCEGPTHSGNVTLEDAADVEALRGIVKLEGSLVVGSSLASLVGLESLACITGDLRITETTLPALDGLQGLRRVSREVRLERARHLENVDALRSLEQVGATLLVDACDALTDLEGLGALISVGMLVVVQNERLERMDGLSSLADVGTLIVHGNPSLSSVSGFPELRGLDLLHVHVNPSLTTLRLPTLTVASYVRITDNAELPEIDLRTLTTVRRDVDISSNPSLTSLEGFASMTTVEGSVTISDNEALPHCSIEAWLSTISVGNDVSVHGNLNDTPCR